MNDIKFVDSATSELFALKADSRLNLSMRDQIDHLLSELQFLQLYLQCLVKWNEALQGKKNRHLGAVKNAHIKATLVGATKGLHSTGITALATQNFQEWDNMASDLLRRIQLSKPKIKDDSLYLFDCTFQCRFSSSELQKFFSNFSNTLDEIIQLKSDKNIKVQIQGIKEKLHFFAQIFELTRKVRSSNKDLKDFNVRIQAWAHKAACLSLLYWVQEDENEQEMPIFFSTPELTRLFLAVLKHLWSLSHNRLLMDEGVPKFVDFVMEIFRHFFLKDGIQNLYRNLKFLTTFLLDPPTAQEHREDAESIAKEVQSLICSLNANQIRGGSAEDFQEKLEIVKGKVSALYTRIFLDSTSFDFPRVNVWGFVDSLIDNLREISQSVSTHHIDFKIIKEDLQSLRSFLNDMDNKHLDEDLWRRIINVVYRVQIVVNMSSYLNNCVWYNLKFLLGIKEEINCIKIDIEAIQSQQFDKTTVPNKEIVHISTLSSHVNDMSRMEEVVVGFKDDFSIIRDRLLTGTKRLGTVSIVGTAGQGKTTIAKMLCRHRSVMDHFHIVARCVVSPTYQKRKLLHDILTGIYTNRDIFNLVEVDLDVLLYKYLIERRYLIIMDDMWDSDAFECIKLSFPNNNNGSRILLTSRNLDVVSGISDYIHTLSALSHSESLELLRRSLFQRGDFPNPSFEEVGKQIARNCNGLPQAIVAIADSLLEKVDNLDWWKQMAESLDSQIAGRGGMDLVELSYKDLPEYLKPCFLYLGAFQAEKVIRARRLIQLWVSEGFIHKSDGRSLEDVGMEYLRELVSRSLVVVTNRSSTGGIKTCRIDGLFFEFCLAKVKKENFLQVESGDDLSFRSSGKIYKNYRLCIQSGGDGFFASNPLGPCVHSLLFVPDYTCLNKGELYSICNFKLLHILDLEDMEFNGYFPEEVTLLILLRYLAIWCPSGIISIPPSIANIRNLETFRVKREARIGNEVCLPETLWKMKRLKHVDVGGCTAAFSCDSEPLDNIQLFSAPTLSLGEDAKKLLKRLSKVGKLRCQFNDSCDPNQSGFPALDVLNELESLNVRYVGSLFNASALNFPSTLKKLTLAQFKLPWSEMTTIAKNLQNLEALKLLEDAFDGEIWDMEDVVFPKLKFLKFQGLNIMQWVVTDREAFPCLEQLMVENCYELEEIPFEIADCWRLEKILVRLCKTTLAISVGKIQENQWEMGNDNFEAVIMDVMFQNSDAAEM